jgi:NAD(P)-dependent dehydrogenase (short-subunit alcohol dehydrogenase family)
MTRLDDKAIVMTGAGRGIGAACAKLAATLGARVAVNDIDASEAEATAAAIRAGGGQAIAHRADIARWDEAKGLIDRSVAEWGRIDGLFNNAARFSMARLDELTEGDLRGLLEANVVGTFACTRHAIDHMKRQGRGSIVNVTSGAHMGMLAMSAYGATKGAVASATYTWALEFAGTGIRVNALSPRAETRMAKVALDYSGVRRAPGLPPENNAPLVCYLLSDAAEAVTGQIVRIDDKTLSLIAHPAIALPSLEGEWTVGAIAKAFREELAVRQFPAGIRSVRVVPV